MDKVTEKWVEINKQIHIQLITTTARTKDPNTELRGSRCKMGGFGV